MVVTDTNKTPSSSNSAVSLATLKKPSNSTATDVIPAVTTNTLSDRPKVKSTLQSLNMVSNTANNKILSKSPSMTLPLKKITSSSTKKTVSKGQNDSTNIEDTTSSRFPPSSTSTTTTASTILGVVSSLVESCKNGVPQGGVEVDVFLAATGRLHTLMLGPDLNVKSCILSSVLGMDPEMWGTGEVGGEGPIPPSSSPSSGDTTPTSPPACSAPGGPAPFITTGHDGVRERPLDCLLRVLEGCSNAVTAAAVCALLHQLLAPHNREELRGAVLSSLMAGHAMEAILRCLFRVQDTDGQTGLDAVTLPAYQVMAKLAVKDPRCLVRFRLLGGVLLTHRLLLARLPPNTDAQTLPLLMVLRAVAKNGNNQQQLGRDGCVLTLTKMLAITPKTHATKIKYILEILALLSNYKANIAKCIRDGALADVVRVLERWQQYDLKVLPKILRPVVALLQHVAESKKGRQVLDEVGAVTLLEQFVLGCPDQKHLDLTVAYASTLYLRCRGDFSATLPGFTALPAVTFTVPDDVEESSSVENELIMESSTQPFNSSDKATVPTSSAYNSDDDDDGNDDDIEDNNDAAATTALPGVGESCAFFSALEDTTKMQDEAGVCPKLQMPVEELLKYSTFFPELRRCSGIGDQEEYDYWKNICDPGKDPSPPSSADCYQRLSGLTRSLVAFVKLAHPDLTGACSPRYLEPLYDKQPRMARTVALQLVQRAMRGGALQRVVFDLDSLLQAQRTQQRIAPLANTQRPLSNWDEKRVGRRDVSTPYLNFESRFESGNLRRAVQVDEREYELVLNCDVSSRHHHQWFYFEVSNMEAGVPYVFSIINNEKPGSEYNAGMKPLLYSVKEAMHGRNYWVRTGTNIFYHRNHYSKPHPQRNTNNRYSNTSRNGCDANNATPPRSSSCDRINEESRLSQFNEKGLNNTDPDSRIEDITMASPSSGTNATFGSEPSTPNLSKNSFNASGGNTTTKQGSVGGGGAGPAGKTNYYTATFTIIFPHSYDVCYMAYHYPYNYTNLQRFLTGLKQQSLPADTFFSCQTLCRSLTGNAVPVITITSKPGVPNSKPCVSTVKQQSAATSTDSLLRTTSVASSISSITTPPSTPSVNTNSTKQDAGSVDLCETLVSGVRRDDCDLHVNAGDGVELVRGDRSLDDVSLDKKKWDVPSTELRREQQDNLDSLDCDSLSNTSRKIHDIDVVSDSSDSIRVNSLPAVTSDKHSGGSVVVVDDHDSQVSATICDNVDVVRNRYVVDVAKSTFIDEDVTVYRNCKSEQVSHETRNESVVDDISSVIVDSDSTATRCNNVGANVESSKKCVDVSEKDSLRNNVKSIAIKYSDLFADDGSCKVKVPAKTAAGVGSVNKNCDNIKRNFVKFNEMSNKNKSSSCLSKGRKINKRDIKKGGVSEEKPVINANKSAADGGSNILADGGPPSEQLSSELTTASCPPKVKDAAGPPKISECRRTPDNEDTPDFSTAVAVEDMWSKITGSVPPAVDETAAQLNGSSMKEQQQQDALQLPEADQDSYNRVKPVVFLTSRVHPCETNASWIMQGSLVFLLSDAPAARALRARYVFKVVPMLNPEGVIHGNTRCGLTAEDLNRRWRAPSPRLHPTIYNTKALLEYLTRIVSKGDVSSTPHSSASRNNLTSGASTPSAVLDDTDAKDDWLASWGAADDGVATTMSSANLAEDSNNGGVKDGASKFPGDVPQANGRGGGAVSSAGGGTPASNVVRVFCDYHGHSRQKNLFLYGCSRQLSWQAGDSDLPDNLDLMELPQQCQRSVPAFSARNCCYTVEAHREATARVTVWRQCAIACSYTLEASSCGCDQGPYKGYHLGTHQLLESGSRFCQSLLQLRPGDWDTPQAAAAAAVSTDAGDANNAALLALQAAPHHPRSTAAVSQTRGKKRFRKNSKPSPCNVTGLSKNDQRRGSLTAAGGGAASVVSGRPLKKSPSQPTTSCLPLVAASDDDLSTRSSFSKPISFGTSDNAFRSTSGTTPPKTVSSTASPSPLVSNNKSVPSSSTSSTFSSFNKTKRTGAAISSQAVAGPNRAVRATDCGYRSTTNKPLQAGTLLQSPTPPPKPLSLLSPSGFLAFDSFTSSSGTSSTGPHRAKKTARETDTEAEFDRDLYYCVEHENTEGCNLSEEKSSVIE